MSSPSRPPRQATACEWCRAHKLKCDAEQPSCRNCARRSLRCVTTNLRKPNAEGRRQTPVGRRHRQKTEYPLLACAYAVCSLAADEQVAAVSPAGTRYLEAVYFLYAHLVALPYVSSIQALLLLTLVLRNRNKDAAAWGALDQAIRLGQSIGLHRRGQTDKPDVASRVWWTAYILERTMELETGRPSAIRDEECDQVVSPSVTESTSVDYFSALIGLAKIKKRVVNLLYGSSNRPVKDLLFEMGHLDRALLDWADDFPESVRPGRDLICSGEELPLATYVALQYHQTLIALNRPALLSAPGFLRNRINEYCAGTPLHDRLHFSLCIGAASARTMLKATNDLSMYAPVPGHISRLVTADQILLAVLVLGIYVAKVPLSRLNRADLALVDTFGELVEEEYRKAGHGPEFLRGITLFRSQLCEYIAGIQGRKTAEPPTVETTPATITCPETEPQPDLVEFGFDLTEDGDVMNLEASWAHFWNEDFEKMLALPALGSELHTASLVTTNMTNMTNMYLLGIPQSWS
ncbi:hypothetical protein SEUCBS140593_009525 [Sporothrix eucalyptigena]|uniref:Zn(2)-C6 fungal-type domain-containing protein n=1 Tax=Sporothrix eucalyptigena TaxID=1812306 RepID=A0ABP0CX80_9PEZI